MGLDQYLRGEKFLWKNYREPEKDRVEDGYRVDTLTLDLGYWRKHPNLHGYIVQAHGGGRDECQEIELDAHAIRDIIRAIGERELPETSGFFFGKSDGTPAEVSEDTAVFEAALRWLEENEEQPALTPPDDDGPLAGLKGGLAEAGLAIKQVRMPKTMPKESRRVYYRASW